MNIKLTKSFYVRSDTLKIAGELLGKYLITDIDGKGQTGGIITETEAYLGASDKASHAYGNKKTPRNEKLYAEGGTAYVYFCYGMYYLFNAVTGAAGTADAVLIRAVEPRIGIDLMEKRRLEKLKNSRLNNLRLNNLRLNNLKNKNSNNINSNNIKIKTEKLSSGPGLLTIALGIDLRHNGTALCGGENDNNFKDGLTLHSGRPDEIWIEDRGILLPASAVETTPRIGVAYAGDHALLPWRFKIAGSFLLP